KKVVSGDIAARAGRDGELVQKGDPTITAVHWTSGSGYWNRSRRAPRTEGDLLKDVSVTRRAFCASVDDRQPPENVRGHRRVAEAVIAGLIAEVTRHLQLTGRRRRGDVEHNADRELVLEDQQRLRLPNLLEFGCRWENDLAGFNAVRSVDREYRWDQCWVARRIGLDVKPLWYSDLNRGANGRPWRRVRFDKRRQLCPDALQLRD